MITYTFNYSNGVQVTETFTPFGSVFSVVNPADGFTGSAFDDGAVVKDSFAESLATIEIF